MTGKQLYEQALCLLGLTEEEAEELQTTACGCINQMLSDHLYENNALLQTKGSSGMTTPPELISLEEELPYEEMLVRECFSYGLAALLCAEDDRSMFNWLMSEYERRLQYYAPCSMTIIRGMDE